MELKPSMGRKPNKDDFLRTVKRVFSGIKTALGYIRAFFKTVWELLCRNRSFARFVYVTLPAKKAAAMRYIKNNKLRLIIPAAICAAALCTILALTLKETENADYLAEGEKTPFAMVLQNYSTFDHSQPTHVAVRLSWDDGAVELNNGKAEAKIKATVYPVHLKYEKLEWTSSDDEVAKIDSGGAIEASSPGATELLAKLRNVDREQNIAGETEAVAELAVRQPVSGIFLPTSTITLYTDNSTSRMLTARVFPENASNKNVTWKSKNTSIATVDSEGRVRAVGVGMTEIIATTEEGGFESKCFVNVLNPSVNVEKLSVQNSADMVIREGENVTAIVTVSPSNARNKTLRWSSDNEEVATVSQAGRIKGIKAGTANITVSSVNGIEQTFTVEVTASDAKDPFDLRGDIELDTAGTVTYTSYSTTFPQAVSIQMRQNPPPKIWRSGGMEYASEAETAEYMNPSSYYTDAYKYQFLDLSRSNGVSAEQLNTFLADKGILRGTGAAFVEAAKEYNVSEVYLVAHACLESGNGTSQLSTGVDVNGTTVYNVFGIAAYDSSPLYSGSQKAYSEGWTSVENAIMGGAKWISQYYINADCRQNTLYKMLWNPENPGVHQYATDIGWAVKQAVSIEKIFASFDGASLSFDIPVYSGQIPPTVETGE